MSAAPDRVPAGRIKLTYDDYASLPRDGRRYEILGGELAVTPAPSSRHQMVLRNLAWVLHGHVRVRGLGNVLFAPIDVILSTTTVVQPDLLFVRSGREVVVTERGIEGAPDLIVEILSPSSARQDRIVKGALYARHGVRHYWIVDPEARGIELYELEEEAYRLIAKAAGEEPFSPSLFPGLEIDLGEVWSE
jgi:Uma2 family endonuclease